MNYRNATNSTKAFEDRNPELLRRYSERGRASTLFTGKHGNVCLDSPASRLAIVRRDMSETPRKPLSCFYSPFSHIRDATRYGLNRPSRARGAVYFEKLENIPGRADSIWHASEGRGARHGATGYYADNHGDLVFSPVVISLTVCNRRYLIPGYVESNNDGYVLDFDSAVRVARNCDENAVQRKDFRAALPLDTDELEETKRDAHSFAERQAETAREYDEAWHRGARAARMAADISEDMDNVKAYLRAVYNALRASSSMPDAIHRFVADTMRPIVEREAEKFEDDIAPRIEELRNLFPSDRDQSDLADAFRDGFKTESGHIA